MPTAEACIQAPLSPHVTSAGHPAPQQSGRPEGTLFGNDTRDRCGGNFQKPLDASQWHYHRPPVKIMGVLHVGAQGKCPTVLPLGPREDLARDPGGIPGVSADPSHPPAPEGSGARAAWDSRVLWS